MILSEGGGDQTMRKQEIEWKWGMEKRYNGEDVESGENLLSHEAPLDRCRQRKTSPGLKWGIERRLF